MKTKNILIIVIVTMVSVVAAAESMYTTLARGSSYVSVDTSGSEWVVVNREAAKLLYDHQDAQEISDLRTVPNIENLGDRQSAYNFKQIGNWICGKMDRSEIGQRVADFFLLRNEGIGGFYYNCQSIL